MQLLGQLFTAYSQAVSSFFYIGIVLLVYLQIQKNARLEESWLGILRNPVTTQLYYVLLYGLIGGLLTSFILLVFGITIEFESMLFIWTISLILMLINPRYLCPAYSIGIISLVSLVFKWPTIDVIPLVILAGILHLIEGLLIFIDGARDSIPVHIEHYRFMPAGAYIMHKMWPIPLATIISPSGLIFPAVVVLIYDDWAITQTPHNRIKESSFWMVVYGLVTLILALMSRRLDWLIYIAVLYGLLFQELLFHWNKKGQIDGKPAFLPPWRGMRVLDVLPDKAGKAMGLKQGDIILDVNGKQVNSEIMLSEILSDFPSFIWIKVLRDEETMGLEYRDYEEGIGELGVMFVPRTTGKYYIFKQ